MMTIDELAAHDWKEKCAENDRIVERHIALTLEKLRQMFPSRVDLAEPVKAEGVVVLDGWAFSVESGIDYARVGGLLRVFTVDAFGRKDWRPVRRPADLMGLRKLEVIR